MDCGHDPVEIEQARAGEHTYAEYRIFGDLSLVLCNFCGVDFSSYHAEFFGLPRGTRLGHGERDWQFVREVSPAISKDKCCTACGHRLPFLEFVVKARELHSVRSPEPGRISPLHNQRHVSDYEN